jgi:hypothetical protein
MGLFVCFAAAGSASATLPLITDDTDTQGKGNTQLENVHYGLKAREK